MDPYLELVESARLETKFHRDITTHIFHESGSIATQRRLLREETWQYQRAIGQGAYGSVWLEKCATGKEVKVRAVKKIRKFKPNRPSESIGRDFTRELGAVTKFSHSKFEPCFVKSFGWFESPEAIFIAMEYLNHGDLQNYLSHTPQLSEPEGRDISFQILEGLHCMHQNGFAHRDLKPSNILVKSMPPDSWWIKLCDFGISKNLADDYTQSTVKGTLAYMAPELLEKVDSEKERNSSNHQAADMWALGEILVRILTGEPTFQSPVMLLKHVASSRPIPLGCLEQHQITEDARIFIASLLRIPPEERLTSREALLHNWMSIYESPVLEMSDLNAFGSLSISHGHLFTGVKPASEPSAQWSTVSKLPSVRPTISTRSTSPFDQPLASIPPVPEIAALSHPHDHNDTNQNPFTTRPTIRTTSASENDVHIDEHKRKDSKLAVSPNDSNNPYRNGMFGMRGAAATTDFLPLGITSSLIDQTDPEATLTVPKHGRSRSHSGGASIIKGQHNEVHNSSYEKVEPPPPPYTTQSEENWQENIKSFIREGIAEPFSELTKSIPGLGPSEPRPKAPTPEIRSPRTLQPPPVQSEGPLTGVTTYREQIRRTIENRRARRHLTKTAMASEANIDPDLITGSQTEDGREIGEIPSDAVFEFTIKIWFVSVPMPQLTNYVTDALAQFSIVHVAVAKEGVLECWYANQAAKSTVHFKLSFWKERKLVVMSDTYFRFEKLHGNIELYEDMVEALVKTFESNWYANPDNPT